MTSISSVDKIPKKIIVDNDSSGMRLDRFLKKNLNLTHSVICKLIRNKNIRINNKNAKINDRITEKDEILLKQEIETEKISQKEHLVNEKIVNQIKQRIKYEDDDIAIIDKPSGLATQSGGSLKYSLDDIIRQIWPNQAKIVHRLDKETAGLIIIAKNRTTAQKIFESFKNHLVQKEYLAVLHPIPKEKTGTIQTYISEDTTQGKMHKCKNSEKGKLAITDYEIIKIDMNQNIALVKFMPKTGRTHQIRLHAKHIGCAIVGDFKYHGNCDLSKDSHLLAYSIKIPDITPEKIINAGIPHYFIIY